jgi:DNA-binding XRE family transcriptional regulator
MAMDKAEVIEIRKKFGLTQDQMAKILGVSRGSIAKYESEAARPMGEAGRRLKQLKYVIEDPKEFSIFREMLKSADGLAAAAGALGLGSAVATIGPGLISNPVGVLADTAGFTLFKCLKKIFEPD